MTPQKDWEKISWIQKEFRIGYAQGCHIKSFIASQKQKSYKEAEKNTRAHYYERVRRETCQTLLAELVEEIEEMKKNCAGGCSNSFVDSSHSYNEALESVIRKLKEK